MNSNRQHRSHRKHSSKQQPFEKWLSSRLFIIAGTILFLIGLYYSFSSSTGLGGFYNMLLNLFKPSDEAPVMVFPGGGLPTILLYYLPAVLVLIISGLLAKKHGAFTYPALWLSALYLIFIQIKISFYNQFIGGCFYPSFHTASLFLIFTTALLIIVALQHRRQAIIYLICCYFYLSILLYRNTFFQLTFIEYLFIYMVVFSANILWVSLKINRPVVNVVNFIFATGFLGIVWLRKLAVNAKSEYLFPFFIISLLCYLLFYAIAILAAQNKEKPLRRWMQLGLSWVNLAFYLGANSYVLVKYYSFQILWLFVLVLLLFNIAGIYYIKRHKTGAWELPHYFAVMVLAALVFPLLLGHNMPLLFTAGLAVLMLLYATAYNEPSAGWLSVLATAAMLVFYLFNWGYTYLPAMIPGPVLPDGALLLHGILSGAVVTGTLWFTAWRLEGSTIPVSKKWFHKSIYSRVIRAGLLITLFMSLGWIGFSMAIRLTGTLFFASTGWFIAGSLFFIGAITYYSGKHTALKKPVRYAAFGFALLFPPMVQWNMAFYLQNPLQYGGLTVAPLLLHYLALALLIALGIMTVRRIYRRNLNKPALLAGLQLVTVAYLIFLLCSGYDNLTLLLEQAGRNLESNPVNTDQLLTANHYLPRSVLVWALAVVLFIWAVYYKNQALRNISLALFPLVLTKVFVFDFASLSRQQKSMLLVLLGVFLIALAAVYPKLIKKDEKLNTQEKEVENL